MQAGIKKVDNVISKIRDGVKYIKKSGPRIWKFYDTAEKDLNMVTTKKLRIDMCVRWNSTFLMLEHAIFYEQVFWYLGKGILVLGYSYFLMKSGIRLKQFTNF